jgi:5-methylcytosine-specific restriction endonuclease McrA|tara:strand:- start:56 stop:637 length:582 start_codon:yes stop_codon:yes gene_type:complete
MRKLIDHSKRRCKICGDITHPTGKRKSDGVTLRMKDLCTKHHQENVAKRNGKKNYRTLIVNNAGFETTYEYVNHYAKQAGFEDHHDRLNHNAQSAGYISHSDRLNSKHPSRKYRKDYCENIDGRLGFKCTTKITEDMIKAGVLEVDHIIPRTKGGKDDDENLQTLCCNCHKMKGWLFEDGNPSSDKYMVLEST